VRALTDRGDLGVRADLAIGADGRHSIVRERAQLKSTVLGARMDVLWLRLSRKPNDPATTLGPADAGRFLALIDRADYWQIAYVIAKGTADEFRNTDIALFREDLVRLAPFLREQSHELQNWDQVKLLTVAVDRLQQWSRPGLLCIGDAAHAMSPIGGVGINLAIQDAVAAANILGERLLRRGPTAEELNQVQLRRMFPTVAMQWLQVALQNAVIKRVLRSSKPLALPWPLKLSRRFPVLPRIPARVIGIGFLPEHVKTPDIGTAVDTSIAAD